MDRFRATPNDPELKRSFRGHRHQVTAVCFNPNMKQLISSSLDGTVTIWHFKASLRPTKFTGHKGAVFDVNVNPSGTLIASGSKDGTARLWNNTVEAHYHVFKSHSAPVKTTAFSCDGNLLLTASDDKTLKIWQVSDRRFQLSIKAHANWIRSAQFSPDARIIVSGSDDRTVKLWDLSQKSLINTFTDHTGVVNSVRFHPDGTCVAAGSYDKKIKIWDVRSQRLIQHYDAHSDSVNSISFHPNGRYLVSASNDSTLKLWDLRQGQIMYTLHGHEGATTAVNFSPEGDYFCSGGADSIVMVWKSNIGEAVYADEIGGENTFEIPESEPQMAGRSFNLHRSGTKSSRPYSTVQDPKSPGKKQESQKLSQNFLPKGQAVRSDGSFVTEGAPGAQTATLGRSLLQTQQSQPGGIVGVGGRPLAYGDLPEELSGTMDAIVTQLENLSKQGTFKSRTVALMEQRVAVNEDAISVALNYFKDNIELPGKVNVEASKLMQSSGAPHFGGSNYVQAAAFPFYNLETPNAIFKDSLNQRSFELIEANNPVQICDMRPPEPEQAEFQKVEQEAGEGEPPKEEEAREEEGVDEKEEGVEEGEVPNPFLENMESMEG